ncbi:TonB-linked outer membrane protein, SusC/RagA family [Filimonas lacunae]|uniref:TonB-linked outer membrane protein, SusC/RagA family n=1 Tax=Filimonas lacunae TaxID=477680 RepID=A0A173MD25_9BACT|nr:TonB-dependent receptor [Filimonas lacunae]BAV05416.1 TonB-dependent receptor [Filimonas lacunae]SIT21294.1 TonB-linked outer membrane protein, SusC/RagA family [Filimonas lacunae]
MNESIVQRRMKQLVCWLCACLLLLPAVTLAQGAGKIAGTVTNDKGDAVASATVTVKGTKRSVVTDELGHFSIAAAKGQTLLISSVGYADKEIAVEDATAITVSLAQKAEALEDVVVVGYGAQRKKDLTGSVSVVSPKEMKKVATSDVGQMLQGRTSGINVTSDGQPGAMPVIKIRGTTSFGDQTPLYVVDGVMLLNPPRDFSPNDIESIQILKDGTAAAIYGATGANGVVIITTRQGKKNAPLKVEYAGYYGFDRVPRKIPVANRVGYQMLNNESQINGGQTVAPANDPQNPKYINDVDVDWQKEAMKTGHRMNHNLNLSGGGANVTYNASLDYYKQEGNFVGNGPDYTRYTARFNSTQEKGIFKFGQSLSYTHSKENTLTYRTDVLTGGRPPLINDLVINIPTMKIYDPTMPNGYGGTQSDLQRAISLNVVAVNSMFTNFTEVDRTFGVAWAEAQLLKLKHHSLKYKINVSYDKTIARDFLYQPTFDLGFFFKQGISRLDDNSRTYTNGLFENFLTYDLTAGKHTVNVVAGTSYTKNSTLNRYSHAENVDPNYTVLDNGDNKTTSGYKDEYSFFGEFGRLNYSYANKYLLTANIRRDGSSRFAPGNKYGVFPGISAGWRISNEEFIKMPSFISDLKIRGGWGQLGNANIRNYGYLAYLNPNIVYSFGGTRVVGGLQTSVVDPNIRWETKTTTNFGVDATLMGGALDFSAEYYNNKSTDLLVDVPIPASVGATNTTVLTNAASLRNYGMEVTATYHKRNGNFTFDIGANFTTLSNKVLQLGGNESQRIVGGFITKVGETMGQHYGWVTDGIFQSQDQIANSPFQNAATAPGDFKFKDLSGPNGKPDGVIDAYDRTTLGRALPKYYYGVNFTAAYKGFDFTLFASGSGGFLINSGLYRSLMHTTDYINYHEDALKRWTPENPNNEYSRLVANDPNQNGRDSDRKGWLQKGDYLRINTLSLGYTLPKKLTGNAVGSLRVYVTAQNVYTFQAYKSFNPDYAQSRVWEPGYDAGSYPTPRVIMFGVQASF